MKYTHLVSRLISFGLAAVLLALTGFSIWVSVITQEVSYSVSTTVYVSGQYGRARNAVAAEQSLERKYRLEPGPDVQAAHRAAAAALVKALQVISTVGDEKDRALVGQVLALHQRYVRATDQLFAAVDAGDPAHVLAIEHTGIDPAFNHIQQLVNTAADEHRMEVAQD